MTAEIAKGEQRLNDRRLWTLFLRRLGSGDVETDAATIKSFAEMLGIYVQRVLDKLRAHLHNDRETIH
jgi:hypothetical protein